MERKENLEQISPVGKEKTGTEEIRSVTQDDVNDALETTFNHPSKSTFVGIEMSPEEKAKLESAVDQIIQKMTERNVQRKAFKPKGDIQDDHAVVFQETFFDEIMYAIPHHGLFKEQQLKDMGYYIVKDKTEGGEEQVVIFSPMLLNEIKEIWKTVGMVFDTRDEKDVIKMLKRSKNETFTKKLVDKKTVSKNEIRDGKPGTNRFETGYFKTDTVEKGETVFLDKFGVAFTIEQLQWAVKEEESLIKKITTRFFRKLK